MGISPENLRESTDDYRNASLDIDFSLIAYTKFLLYVGEDDVFHNFV